MSQNTIRYGLEASIIAEALFFESGFIEIATFLQPQNFQEGSPQSSEIKKPLFRFIWEVLNEMYPNEPINVLTVSNFCYKNYSIKVHKDLVEVSNTYLHTNMNRPYYCLQILEQDLRMNLIKQIHSLIQSTPHYYNKIILLEMDECLKNRQNDVFEVIDSIKDYLSKDDDFILEYERIASFEQGILKRIGEIKRMSKVKSILSNLDSLYHFSSSKMSVLESILDIFKVLVVSNNLPEDIERSIINFRDRLLL